MISADLEDFGRTDLEHRLLRGGLPPFFLAEDAPDREFQKIQYWRGKHGNEIDFVLVRRESPPSAIECKWSADEFDPRNLKVFRDHYPGDENYVVSADVDRPFTRRMRGLKIRFLGLNHLGPLM